MTDMNRVLFFCGLLVTMSSACATSSTESPPATPGASMVLPPALASRDLEVRADVQSACGLIADFAREHRWDALVKDCFYDRVEVFAAQPNLKRRIIELHNLPADTMLPDGVVAALEKRVLMAITPEENQRINPEYTKQEDSWPRLLAHEIGHRLHVAILDGDEDAMGPTWFFEGFAVVAAGQELGAPLSYSTAIEALAGCHSKDRLAYRRYGAAVRFFMNRVPLATLVKRAGSADFEDWLLSAGDADTIR